MYEGKVVKKLENDGSTKELTIDKCTENFFEEIIQFKRAKKKQKIALIVVSHAVYDLHLFLKAMQGIGNIFKIIFKSSHPNKKIYDEISQEFPSALKHN